MLSKIILITVYLVMNGVALFLLDYWMRAAFPRPDSAGAAGPGKVADLYVLTELGISSGAYRRRSKQPFFIVRIASEAIIAAFVVLSFIAAFMPPSRPKYVMSGIIDIWLGFFMFFEALLCAAWIERMIWTKAMRLRYGGDPFGTRRRPRKAFARGVLAAALMISLSCNIAGAYNAYHVKETDYDVTVSGKRKEGELTVALVSDLHLGANTSVSQIGDMKDVINSSDPDIVVMAGDIFSDSLGGMPDPDGIARELSDINSRYGVFAVYGNHDIVRDSLMGFALTSREGSLRDPGMDEFLERCGVTVLDDEVLPAANGLVVLAGRKDAQKTGDGTPDRLSAQELIGAARAEEGTESEAATGAGGTVIFLDHEPDDIKNEAEAGADLILCGHTHGGQIFPGNIFTRVFNDVTYGKAELYGADVIVTSGVGFYGPPVRLGTKSEVVIVRLAITN